MAISIHHVDYDPLQHSLPPRRYAWTVFAIVFALMVVDYVDRQVVVSMFPHLKAQWTLSDGQLGGLVSVVSIMVALGTIPLSLLADRWSRVKSIFLMALVWSIATIACAFAQNYGHLLIARSIVGLGEAAYGSAGVALLATMFPARMRSTVLGAFLAAGLVGSVLGVVLGGIISTHWGWQAGFGAVGVPGLLLAILFIVVVRDYKTVALPTQRSHRPTSMAAGAIASELLRPRTALITCIGAGLQLVMVSTTWAWMPSYFNRFYGLAPDQAGVKTGLVVLVGGIGAVVWSVVADRMSGRFPRARLQVPAIWRCADCRVHVRRVRRAASRQSAIRVHRRRCDDDDGEHRTRVRRRRRRRPSRGSCNGRFGAVARAKPVRARGRTAAGRFPLRRLRLAVRAVGHPGVLPARRRLLLVRCPDVLVRSSARRRGGGPDGQDTGAPACLNHDDDRRREPRSNPYRRAAKESNGAQTGDG
jgi:predicted MFS family arabinose efflux permease